MYRTVALMAFILFACAAGCDNASEDPCDYRCRVYGECLWTGEQCEAESEYDCNNAEQCQSSGMCHRVYLEPGAAYAVGYFCLALSDLDCQMSDRCAEYDYCYYNCNYQCLNVDLTCD